MGKPARSYPSETTPHLCLRRVPSFVVSSSHHCLRTFYRVSAVLSVLCFIFLLLEALAAGIITIYVSSTFNTIQVSEHTKGNKFQFDGHLLNHDKAPVLDRRDKLMLAESLKRDIDYEVLSTKREKLTTKDVNVLKAVDNDHSRPEDRKVWEVRRRWKKLAERIEERSQLLWSVDQSRWDNWKCEGCFNNEFEFSRNSFNICQTRDQNDEIQLLFIITTQPMNYENRETLRRTWLTVSQNNTGTVRYIFLLGTVDETITDGLHREMDKHNDIVIGNFTDNYTTLTIKTLAGLSWATTYCNEARHVMKTDDDMWINTPKLIPLLSNLSSTKFVGGACLPDVKPIRTLTGKLRKFYLPYTEFRYKNYPPYCQGLGIVLSQDVIGGIVDVSRNVPFFKFEDVYLGLCFARLRLRLVNIMGFQDNYYSQYVQHYNLTLCNMKDDKFLTIHQVPNNVILQGWGMSC